LLKTAGLYYIF